MVLEFEPHIRLCTDSSEPGACFRFRVSLSLCPLCESERLTLCVSQKNKQTLKNTNNNTNNTNDKKLTADRVTNGLDGVGEESRMTRDQMPVDRSLGGLGFGGQGGKPTEFCFGAF